MRHETRPAASKRPLAKVVCTAAVLSLLLVQSPAALAEHWCQPAVETMLGELGVNPERVNRISVANKRVLTGEGPRDLGLESWVRFEDCRGALVVEMTDFCWIKQVYTRDDCEVAGVPNY